MRITVLTAALATGLLAGSVGGVAMARPAPTMMKDKIVVKITKANGTVWGKVTADWMESGKSMMGKACTKAKCVYHVPHMTKITLTESPVNGATWPFKHWLIKGSSMGKSSMSGKAKVTFEASGHKATAHAVYVAM